MQGRRIESNVRCSVVPDKSIRREREREIETTSFPQKATYSILYTLARVEILHLALTECIQLVNGMEMASVLEFLFYFFGGLCRAVRVVYHQAP